MRKIETADSGLIAAD